jgi:hypothetical protein
MVVVGRPACFAEAAANILHDPSKVLEEVPVAVIARMWVRA